MCLYTSKRITRSLCVGLFKKKSMLAFTWLCFSRFYFVLYVEHLLALLKTTSMYVCMCILAFCVPFLIALLLPGICLLPGISLHTFFPPQSSHIFSLRTNPRHGRLSRGAAVADAALKMAVLFRAPLNRPLLPRKPPSWFASSSSPLLTFLRKAMASL